jgi:hypothetical protein
MDKIEYNTLTGGLDKVNNVFRRCFGCVLLLVDSGENGKEYKLWASTAPNLNFNADPDQAFHSNLDPEPDPAS